MKFLNQLIATAICYICTTLGILYTIPSSTLKLFSSENTILDRIMTETEISLMGSLSSISILVIIPLCGYLMDTLGRKGTLIVFYLPQLIAWLLLLTIFKVEAFICAMFLCGLSGCIFLIFPIYVSEYCHVSIRGALSSTAIISHGLGILVSYLFGGLLEYTTMIYTGLTSTLFGFVLICFLKESPVYLIKKGFDEEAAKSIAFYKEEKPHSEQVITEMNNIRRLLNTNIVTINSIEELEALKLDKNKPKEKLSIWKYLIKSQSSRRALTSVLILQAASIFQGLVVVQMFAEPLFEVAAPSLSPTLSSVLFALIVVVASLIGAYLIDTVGRRILIISTSIITGLFSVILATQLQLNWGPSWLSSILIYLYTFSYSVGPGGVPYVLLGEVFLPEIRSLASTICLEWAFICNFIILFIFNPIFNVYGLGPVFYFFAGFSIITSFFSYIYLPETKGLTVDVIQKKYLQRKKY